MGSIRVAVVGLETGFTGALTAYLSSQPVFEIVDTSQAEVIVTGERSKSMQLPEEAALLLIGPEEPDAMIAAVEAGAMGYVASGSPLEEIARAVQAVADGEAVVPTLMLGALLKHVVRRQRARRADLDLLASLTEREREVFDLLAAGHDRTVIAHRLYISVGTVRSHLQRVFAKLNLHTHAEAVAFAARCGLRTDDTGSS